MRETRQDKTQKRRDERRIDKRTQGDATGGDEMRQKESRLEEMKLNEMRGKEHRGVWKHIFVLLPPPYSLICLLFLHSASFPRSPVPRLVQVEESWSEGLYQNLQGLREKVIGTMWDEASSGINFPYELTPETLADKNLERMKRSQCPAPA